MAIPKENLSVEAVHPLDLLSYEVQASWWAGYIGWDWAQDLASAYYAWKVRRKYNRYVAGLLEKKRVATLKQLRGTAALSVNA